MFLTELKATFERGSSTAKLDSPLIMVVGSDVFVVPKGFITDFASIPHWLHGVLNPTDPTIRDAAVVHDFLYTRTVEVTRYQADILLFKGMGCLNAPLGIRVMVLLAVRLFGWNYWVD